tara:strand:+ start:7848 stop:8072 length:225 start_codon:yes stop_codon:yes gene_type:complete
MTEYFLIYDSDEPISLGTDNSFGVFWGEQGMTALMKMVDKHPDELHKVVIKTDKGKKMSVSEFLSAIAELKVRV